MSGWRKSSYSGLNGECVWIWEGCRTVWVRDEAGGTLVVDRGDWAALVRHVRETA